MIEIVTVDDTYREAWEAFVHNSPRATISHRFDWSTVIREGLSHKPHYLLAVEQGNPKGILPLFEVKTWWGKRYLISIPWLDYGGVCAEDSHAEELLLKAARHLGERLGAEFVELRSVEARFRQIPQRRDKVTFLLDMRSGEEALWSGFDAKLRNQIRKARKSGLHVRFGGRELLDDFYTVFCRNMRDLGTPVWGRRLFGATLEYFGRQAEIVIVAKDERPIAGGLLLHFKKTLYVPSASAYRQSRSMCPNHAMYWETIKRGCSRGYDWFDFGRSTWEGPTFRFKKQWVPEPTQLVWQYALLKTSEIPMLNPNNKKYEMLISLWRRLPLGLANRLGPYVIKNFP